MDLGVFDHLDRAGRVKGRHEHVGTARPRHAVGESTVGKVKLWSTVEVAVVLVEMKCANYVQGVRCEVGVGEHRPLWKPCGSAGVKDRCDGVAPACDVGEVSLRRGRQRVIRQGAVRGTGARTHVNKRVHVITAFDHLSSGGEERVIDKEDLDV